MVAQRRTVPGRHRTGAALLHRQAGLGAVESLDLRLLINRQHHGMGRRVDIQADDIRELLGKGGIIGELEVPPAVRAEAMGLPDRLDRRRLPKWAHPLMR